MPEMDGETYWRIEYKRIVKALKTAEKDMVDELETAKKHILGFMPHFAKDEAPTDQTAQAEAATAANTSK